MYLAFLQGICALAAFHSVESAMSTNGAIPLESRTSPGIGNMPSVSLVLSHVEISIHPSCDRNDIDEDFFEIYTKFLKAISDPD